MKKTVLAKILVGFLAAIAPFAHADDEDGAPWGPPGVILVIGDSHSAGTFGKTLDQELRTQFAQAKVSTYASSSATPAYYFDSTPSHGGFFAHPDGKPAVSGTVKTPETITPSLPRLLDQTHAQVTVVALGTNLIGVSDEEVRKQITETVQAIQVHHSHCIWVGEPDLRPDTPRFSIENQNHLYFMLKGVTMPLGCPFVDSRAYTSYPPTGGHGIHYDDLGELGREKGRAWADAVTREITKIVMEPNPFGGRNGLKGD